jgi:hypothetical protein
MAGIVTGAISARADDAGILNPARPRDRTAIIWPGQLADFHHLVKPVDYNAPVTLIGQPLI